jgi:hypothetical protein
LTQTESAGNPEPGVGEVMAPTTGFATTVNEGVIVVVPQLFLTAKEIAGVPEVLKVIFWGLEMFNAPEVVPPGKVHK